MESKINPVCVKCGEKLYTSSLKNTLNKGSKTIHTYPCKKCFPESFEICFKRKPKNNDGMLYEIDIEEMDIPTRAINAIKKAGINSVGDLLEHKYSALISISGLGRRTLWEIEDELNIMGLSMK